MDVRTLRRPPSISRKSTGKAGERMGAKRARLLTK